MAGAPVVIPLSMWIDWVSVHIYRPSENSIGQVVNMNRLISIAEDRSLVQLLLEKGAEIALSQSQVVLLPHIVPEIGGDLAISAVLEDMLSIDEERFCASLAAQEKERGPNMASTSSWS